MNSGATSFLRLHGGLFLVFLSGIIITLFLFRQAQENTREELHRHFEMDAQNRATFYVNDLRERIIDLVSIKRFYDGSEEVKPDEFNAFVFPIFSEHPGAHAIFWAPHPQQASGEFHFPIVLVEPSKSHETFQGFDSQTNPQCLQTLTKAMDSGFPAVTNLIHFPGEEPEEPGFLVYVPVNEGGLQVTTVPERRKNLRGFVIGMFIPKEVATAIMSQLPIQGLFTDLMDVDSPQDKQLTHHWIPRKPSMQSGFAHPPQPSSLDLHFSRAFRFADRHWEIRITAADSYVEGIQYSSSWLVLFAGFTLTLLLTLYLQTILSQQERTEALVAERTLALSDSEKRYRSLAKNLPGIVYRIDVGAGGTMTFLNDMLETLTGYAPGDLPQNQSFWLYPFVHPDDRMKVVESLEHAMEQGQPFQAEYRLKVKSGKFLFFSEYGRPIRDDEGKTLFIEGVIFDSTARKEAEVASREYQQMFRLVLDTIPVRVFWKNRNFTYLGCNRPFATDSGLESPDLILGRNDQEMTWAKHAEDYQKIDRAIIEQGISKLDSEEERSLAKGRRSWLRISKVPLRNSENQIIGVLGTYEDITAKKTIEAEKEKLLEELTQKNEELESIVYVASHDLRSPLVNIQGFTHRLEKFFTEISAIFKESEVSETQAKSLHELLEDHAPKALHFIKSSSHKMDTLINGLLKMSRTGQASLVMEKLDMNAMFEAILAAMNFQIQSQQVTMHLEHLPPCYGDKVQINQVFSNLLDNALKYRAHDRPLEIWVTGRQEYDTVMYSVRDSGKGIDREHQEKIWVLFHRLDPQCPVTGEGLGLSLAKRIIERHKGRITVESTLGRGSCFFVELPAV